MAFPTSLTRRPRVLSYGGGADSFAVLLSSILLGEKPDVVAFVDVSNGSVAADPTDPGEWDGTYRHIREVVIPLCRREGIRFEWIDSRRYPVRDAPSLFAWMWDRGQIPVAGKKRICTIVAKVERFERWLMDTFGGREVEVWIGFEAGEEDRAEKDPNAGRPGNAGRVNRFPLIEQEMCRCRAVALIQALGYPVPRKSACKFCPYASLTDWQTLAREDPADFARIAELEARKPPTRKAGIKLSIMGFKKRADGTYRAPPLPVYIQGKARGPRGGCSVCGATARATKATGCGWLDEPRAAEAA